MTTATEADELRWERFTLLGGPLHRLGERLGLVRGSRTFALGVAIGLSLWLVAAVLAWRQGLRLDSLSMLGAHVRLLVAIPLLFLAETLLDPRLNDFMHVMVRSRVVPGRAQDALVQRLARVKRWANARWPDLACLAVAIGLLWLLPSVHKKITMGHPIVMGRKTFETVLGFRIDWPYSIPVFVLSTTLKDIPENLKEKVFLVKGTVHKVLNQIHEKGFHRLYIDGGTTIQNFLKEDVIDEMILTTIPVLLGGGSPLFSELQKSLSFELLESKTYLNQITQSHYKRKR